MLALITGSDVTSLHSIGDWLRRSLKLFVLYGAVAVVSGSSFAIGAYFWRPDETSTLTPAEKIAPRVPTIPAPASPPSFGNFDQLIASEPRQPESNVTRRWGFDNNSDTPLPRAEGAQSEAGIDTALRHEDAARREELLARQAEMARRDAAQQQAEMARRKVAEQQAEMARSAAEQQAEMAQRNAAESAARRERERASPCPQLANVAIAGFKLTCDILTFGGPPVDTPQRQMSYSVGSIEDCAAKCRPYDGCSGFSYDTRGRGSSKSCYVFALGARGQSGTGWITGTKIKPEPGKKIKPEPGKTS